MSKATRERSNLPPLGISKAPDRVVRVGDPGAVSLARVVAADPLSPMCPEAGIDGPRAVMVAPRLERDERPDPVWNNLRRLWMVDGEPIDPQPSPPGLVGRVVGIQRLDAPPSLKVQA